MLNTVSQLDFIRIAKETKNIVSVTQRLDGTVCLIVRPEVQILHRTRSSGTFSESTMMIIFTENQDRFLIPDRQTLKYLLMMHEQNADFVQRFHAWCIKNLEAI